MLKMRIKYCIECNQDTTHKEKRRFFKYNKVSIDRDEFKFWRKKWICSKCGSIHF